ncbi:MFS transporter [Pseudomonas coleopterorum]|uniref:MFS transporter n=1 Tax=Pseudomonas coleopterorum TaxID=1605838 RepID=A0ABR9BZP8_9PSED|nr:MFS transporter [Pseudomonas coleopterorum]MBD8769949.1 MFS transporter [Pseudomonas coleopterorum]
MRSLRDPLTGTRTSTLKRTSTAIFSQPGFRAFLMVRLAAMFAMQIQAIVVAWHMYDMTRHPLTLAYVGLAQFIPMVLLLLPAGDLLDRFDRRRILQISWGVSVLSSAALLWLALTGTVDTWPYYVALFVFGCTRAFTGPAVQSLLPQIVAREHLAQAIATNSMIMKVAVIAGPLLGGLLYAAIGGWTFGVCLLGFAIGVLLLQWVPSVRIVRPVDDQTTAVSRFTAGIRFITSRPIILGAISLDLFAVLLGGVVALLPIYAAEILHVGPAGLGLLRSAIALGELGMGFYLSIRPLNARMGQRMFLAVAVFGVANLVFALSTWFWVSCAALFVAGAADMISVYIRSSLIQFATPDDMRGRVSAVNMLFIGSSNELGEFRAGVSATALGTVPAALFGAISTLVIVGLWTRLFRPLWTIENNEQALPERQKQPG